MSDDQFTRTSSEQAMPEPCPEWGSAFKASVENGGTLPLEVREHIQTCERCAAAYRAHPLAPLAFKRVLSKMSALRSAAPPALGAAPGAQSPEERHAPNRVQPPQEIPPGLERLLAIIQEAMVARSGAPAPNASAILTVEDIIAPYLRPRSADLHDAAPEQPTSTGAGSGDTVSADSLALGVNEMIAASAAPDMSGALATPAFDAVTARAPSAKPLSVNTLYYQVLAQRFANAWVARSPSFRKPDQMEWREEAHYSYAVGKQLTQLYWLLERRDAPRARRCLEHLDTAAMSIHQRLCLEYASGMVALTDKEYTSAWAHFDDALEVSHRVNDQRGSAALACLRGAASYHVQQYGAAITYYTLALDLIRALNETRGGEVAADSALELESLTPLASSYFVVGQFERSRQVIEDARRLVARASAEQQRDAQGMRAVRKLAAEIEWVAALLFRWSGAPEQALRHAMAASEVYSAMGEQGSLGRISIVIADIALDLADAFADLTMTQLVTRSQQLYSSLAEPYILLATTTLRAQGDLLGAALADLARVRFERATRQTTPRMATIKEIAKVAQHYGDVSLLGLAQTALGDEFQSNGEREQSLACYRLALDTLRATNFPAMGIWAQRHLLQAAELTPS